MAHEPDNVEGSQQPAASSQQPESCPGGISRRRFLGGLTASAAAGAFASHLAKAHPEQEWFYDSHGRVVPANPTALSKGLRPPPLPMGAKPPGRKGHVVPYTCATTDPTYVSGGYPQPNILLIMVDQMRQPRWLTTGQWNAFQASIMPNVYGTQAGSLLSQSYEFWNYFVPATPCTPSRCTLLTGLYPQQTCMLVNNEPSQNANGGTGLVLSPSLLPYNGGTGFACIGDVLRQSLNINCGGSTLSNPYNTAWIGKWHVSDYNFTEDPVGGNGPSDYGFVSAYNIPTNSSGGAYMNAYPSPNGLPNEGTGGDELGNTSTGPAPPVFTYNIHGTPMDPRDVNAGTLGITTPPPVFQLSDAAIYDAFRGGWLRHGNAQEPWFLAVSFVNPHDMSAFPWDFGLATDASGEHCGALPGNAYECAAHGGNIGFYPPPVLGWNDTFFPTAPLNFNGLPYLLYNSATGVGNNAPSDWNYNEIPNTLPYNYNPSTYQGKPGLQAFFGSQIDAASGIVNDKEPGWYTFLNYYYWMQSCVDTLVGLVYTSVQSSGANDPLIIFTSDHGDFGGSHWLHSKGGALYDEVMNVPLLIHMPGQSTGGPIVSDFVCSSVDILPFIYSAAIGNETWRTYSGDIVSYLNGRESIYDVIYSNVYSQRRVAPFTNAGGWGASGAPLPYVLHCADQYSAAYLVNSSGEDRSVPQPGHAIGFRTLDNTVVTKVDATGRNIYGGAKLGMYTTWLPCTTFPNVSASGLTPPQFELYDYYPPANNYGEMGNNAFDSSGNWVASKAGLYVNSYNNIMAGELYKIDAKFQNAYNTAFMAYMTYLNAAVQYYNTDACFGLGPPGGVPNTIPWPG